MKRDSNVGRIALLLLTMTAAAATLACDASVECGEETSVSNPDTTTTSKGDTSVTSGDSTTTTGCKGSAGVEIK